MSRWKEAEKKAASAFGVERVIRFNFGDDAPDTTPHPIFSIEVKSRKKISSFLTAGLEQARRYYKEKLPLLTIFERYKRDGLVVMYLADFQKLLELNGLEKQPESASESKLDGILEITQDKDGKFKVSIKQ